MLDERGLNFHFPFFFSNLLLLKLEKIKPNILRFQTMVYKGIGPWKSEIERFYSAYPEKTKKELLLIKILEAKEKGLPTVAAALWNQLKQYGDQVISTELQSFYDKIEKAPHNAAFLKEVFEPQGIYPMFEQFHEGLYYDLAVGLLSTPSFVEQKLRTKFDINNDVKFSEIIGSFLILTHHEYQSTNFSDIVEDYYIDKVITHGLVSYTTKVLLDTEPMDINKLIGFFRYHNEGFQRWSFVDRFVETKNTNLDPEQLAENKQCKDFMRKLLFETDKDKSRQRTQEEINRILINQSLDEQKTSMLYLRNYINQIIYIASGIDYNFKIPVA